MTHLDSVYIVALHDLSFFLLGPTAILESCELFIRLIFPSNRISMKTGRNNEVDLDFSHQLGSAQRELLLHFGLISPLNTFGVILRILELLLTI